MGNIIKYRGFVHFRREEIDKDTNLLKEIPLVYIAIRNIVAVYELPKYDGRQTTIIQCVDKTFTINLPIEKVMDRIDGVPLS